ncbi:MAG: long-chain-fatty-acid--CoA ligase [Micrococcales bacterium]|nr:long-chain-fatty-acid--CoA ligase [Micrococcales bacterium]
MTTNPPRPSGAPAHVDLDDSTLVDQFERVVASHPRSVAFDFLGATTTYAAAGDAVLRVASALAELGIGPGDRVALLMPNCPQHVIAFEAVLRLGAVAVEHNPLYTADELRAPFHDHGASVAIVWDKAVPTVTDLLADSALEHVIAVDITRSLPLAKRIALRLPLPAARRSRAKLSAPAPEAIPWARLLKADPLPADHPHPTASDTALLLYTSGTSGRPKGVPLTHRNLVANVLQGRAWVPGLVEGEETVLVVLPMFHAYGITISVLAGISMAARLVLLPAPENDLVMAAIKRRVPTFLPAVPPLYARILDQAEARGIPLEGIRAALSGAMALPPELVERWESATSGYLVEGYGLTETSPVVVGNPMSADRKPGSIGVPFPDTQIRVVDPEDPSRVVDRGQPGELLVRGPQVCGGYRDLPEETAEAFHDGWFRTGDVVTEDEEGFLTVVDRIKEVIITGGFNVYPSEVEGVLRAHPHVGDVAIVGVRQDDGSEQVTAAIVPASEAPEAPDHESLRDHCRHALAAYKVPRRFEHVGELPTNPMGKVLRREVSELLHRRH